MENFQIFIMGGNSDENHHEARLLDKTAMERVLPRPKSGKDENVTAALAIRHRE